VEKIPVWRTIGSAFGFAFGNLATIIGLIWLPLTVLLVGGYFAISHYFDGVLAAIAHGNRYAAYAGAGYFYLYRALALFFEATMAVSVMRYALGQRDKPAMIHFTTGLAELRVFAALVVYTLIVTMIEIAGLLLLRIAVSAIRDAATLADSVDGIAATTIAAWTIYALRAALLAVILFVGIRLSFFLVVLTVAEKKVDLIRCWELTRGNFWRAFLVMLCTGGPVWLVYVGLQFAFVGFAATGEATSALSPMAVQFTGPVQAVSARMHIVLAWVPYLYVAWFLVRPLMLGLSSGAAAAAYRTLVPDAPAVSTPPADGLVPVAIG
jgi:hypothetical protein